jgi:hypothetical protein
MAKKKTLWTPPRDPQTGAFKPRDQWTKSEERAYRKAQREGRIAAAKQAKKMPRGPHGRFTSASGRKKTAKAASEHTVYVEKECPECDCKPVFPGLAAKVAEPLAMTTAQVAQIQTDIAEMKARLKLAPTQPQRNPIETLAIVNSVGERDQGQMSKLWESVRDNPLLAAAAVGAVILIGYLMYRSYRRSQDQTGIPAPAGQPVANGLVTPPGGALPPTAVRPADVIPKHPTYRLVQPTVGDMAMRPNVNVEQQELPGLEGVDGDGEGIFT